MKSKILLLYGKSGSGKTSLRKTFEKYGFNKIMECTNRPIRPGEQNGDDYIFFTDEEINKQPMMGRTDYHTKHGIWRFGLLKTELKPEEKYVVVVNPYQMKEVIETYRDVADLYFLCITVDEEQRIMNLIKREEMKEVPDYTEICRRICTDAKEFSEHEIKRIMAESSFPMSSVIKVYNNYEMPLEEIAHEIIWANRL